MKRRTEKGESFSGGKAAQVSGGGPVLSAADHEHFLEHGYVVVPKRRLSRDDRRGAS